MLKNVLRTFEAKILKIFLNILRILTSNVLKRSYSVNPKLRHSHIRKVYGAQLQIKILELFLEKMKIHAFMLYFTVAVY